MTPLHPQGVVGSGLIVSTVEILSVRGDGGHRRASLPLQRADWSPIP
jgi:hypothetical protein